MRKNEAMTYETPAKDVDGDIVSESTSQDLQSSLIYEDEINVESDMVILVLGQSGAGKSTIINSIIPLAQAIPVNHGLEPSNIVYIARMPTNSGTVCFIEVPAAQKSMESHFPRFYERYNVIGIVFMYNVMSTRVAGELLDEMKAIQRACERNPSLASHIVCITSQWTSDKCDESQELASETSIITSKHGWARESLNGLKFRRFVLQDSNGKAAALLATVSPPLIKKNDKHNEIVVGEWEAVSSLLTYFLDKHNHLSTVSSMKYKEEDYSLGSSKIIILMGDTGTGKTNFLKQARNDTANEIVGTRTESNTLASETEDVQAYPL